MEDQLILQNDGCYVLCFRNLKKVDREEVESIFKRYGDVCSVRHSTDPVPWVFIRYKVKEEAQRALDELKGYKDFDVRIAKSNVKKKQDHDGDQEKSDSFSNCPRENRPIKGNLNRSSDTMKMGNEDSDADNSCTPKTYSLGTSTNPKFNGRPSRPREDAESCRKSFDSSFPRSSKRSPGNWSANGPMEKLKDLESSLPKLVKGSDFYAHLKQASGGLALRAAYNEVWANHPLRSAEQLREVILTNFENVPSKKDIYNICYPVQPLHVSFGTTMAQSVFSRVLVESESDVQHLLRLNGDGMCVFILEELLDELFMNEDGSV